MKATDAWLLAVKPGVVYVTSGNSLGWVFNNPGEYDNTNIENGKDLEVFKITVKPGNSSFDPYLLLMQHELSMEIGSTYTLLPKLLPEGATVGMNFYSSNPETVSVDGGTLTAKAVGNATVTCITANGLREDCNVTVTPKMAQGISLNTDRLTMNVGDQYQFASTITPDADTSKRVLWKSLNSNVVSIDENGMATCNQKGWTVVLATTTDGTNLSAGCFVQVGKDFKGDLNEDNMIDVTDVSILIDMVLGKIS